MEITLELVERLKEKANVSYAQAKEALEYSGGNLLDALIYLEEKGAPCRSSCLSNPKAGPQSPPAPRVREASAAFSTRCAAGWWTMSWKSGGTTSPSLPFRS